MATVDTPVSEKSKVFKYITAGLKALLSMPAVLFLLFIFAFASGVATFIENSYGRDAAREYVYNTRWFEAVITLLTLAAVYNVFKYKLWRRSKWPLLVAHLSFVLIYAGAALTRYAGYEGVLHIREGEMSNEGVSYDHYFTVKVKEGGKVYTGEKMRITSPLTKPGFEEEIKLSNGKTLKLKALDYVPYAKVEIKPKKGGEPLVHVVMEGGYHVVLREGSAYDVRLFRFYFDDEERRDKGVRVYFKGDKLYGVSDKPLSWFKMDGSKGGDIKAGEEFPVEPNRLYRREGVLFLLIDALPEGELVVTRDPKPVKRERELSAMKLEVEYEGKKGVTDLLFVKEGARTYLPARLKLGDAEVELAYGQKVLKLPFYIKLEDFVVERYPGSMAPSSYESKVVVVDPEKGKEFPYRIYMNHTLDTGDTASSRCPTTPTRREPSSPSTGTPASFPPTRDTSSLLEDFSSLCLLE